MLEQTLRRLSDEGTKLDVITFAGNGEPTMHPEFSSIIDDTIKLRDSICPTAKISVLSNATMLGRESVVKALRRVDNNILKLDSAFDSTVKAMNIPSSPSYSVEKVVEQMQQFEGEMILQTMFLRGEYNGNIVDNTTPQEIEAWLELVAKIAPKKVMIYSLDRQSPCPTLVKVNRQELEQISKLVENLGIECSVA